MKKTTWYVVFERSTYGNHEMGSYVDPDSAVEAAKSNAKSGYDNYVVNESTAEVIFKSWECAP